MQVSPIPPLFWWSLFIPTFAVLVWSLQFAFDRLGSNRMDPDPLDADLLDADLEDPEDPRDPEPR